MSGLFLTDEEMQQLTGYARKSKQVAWLKAQGIPFRPNATGHPVVTRTAIEGRHEAPAPAAPRAWTPRVISA